MCTSLKVFLYHSIFWDRVASGGRRALGIHLLLPGQHWGYSALCRCADLVCILETLRSSFHACAESTFPPSHLPSPTTFLLLYLSSNATKQMATSLTLRKVSLLSHSFIDSSPKWVSAGSIEEIEDICVYWSLWEESTVNCSGCWHDVNLPVGCQLTLPRFQGLLFSPRHKSLLLSNSRRVSSLLHVLDPFPPYLTLKDFEALR